MLNLFFSLGFIFLVDVLFSTQVMVPDVAVLARLLDPGCPYSPGLTAKAVTAAAAAASTSSQVRLVCCLLYEPSRVFDT